MASWLFHITDNAVDTVSVLGTGATVEDAEVDATAKWDTAMSARLDYLDRLPVTTCCVHLSTDVVGDDLPTLII